MAAPISSMFSDPVGASQGLMEQLSQETDEQRRKRLQEQKMKQTSGGAGLVSGMLNPAGNQY